MLATLVHDGLALQDVEEELKADEKIVLTALAQNGLALEYAAEEFKGDLMIVH